jgi:peptidoglycan/xylan/chitin deacetylase (PgdA/CDA1 family)
MAMWARTSVRTKVLSCLARSGLLDSLEQAGSRADTLRVLAYHHLGDIGDAGQVLDPELVSTSPEMFKEQMLFLLQRYHPVSCDDVLSALAGNLPLPPRAVLITFDDGYRDFKELAWRVLRALKVPAVLFVATDFMNGDGRVFWWDQVYQAVSKTTRPDLVLPDGRRLPIMSDEDRGRALSWLKATVEGQPHADAMALVKEVVTQLEVTRRGEGTLLTWSDLRALVLEGVSIASHTRSHPLLSRIPAEQWQDEIVGAQQHLKRQLGMSCPMFCYPNGSASSFNQSVVDFLALHGFRAAFSTITGINRIGKTSPFGFRRIPILPYFDLVRFRLCLTVSYQTWLRLRRSR